MNKYTNPTTRFRFVVTVLSLLISHPCLSLAAEPIRVFIFAGQSNMVGSDSKVDDIDRFPPFRGLESAQPNVRFSYSIGRERKTESNGWVDLQPVNNIVGPELSSDCNYQSGSRGHSLRWRLEP